MKDWKIQIALLALWFVIVIGSVAIDNARAGRPYKSYGGAHPIEWDIGQEKQPPEWQAIRALQFRVHNQEQRIRRLESRNK